MIVLPIRNQRRFLLLDVTLGRSLSACHPQRQRALVPPLLVVHDRRGYTISPALLWLEPALNRIGRRFHRALLRILLFLPPLTTLIHPVQQYRAHLDLAAGYGLAIQIGHYRLHDQRLTRLDERARAPYPNIKLCRMDEQRCR